MNTDNFEDFLHDNFEIKMQKKNKEFKLMDIRPKQLQECPYLRLIRLQVCQYKGKVSCRIFADRLIFKKVPEMKIKP